MVVVAGHGKTLACRRWPSPAGHLSYLLAVWPRSSLAINCWRLVSFSVIRAGQTGCLIQRHHKEDKLFEQQIVLQWPKHPFGLPHQAQRAGWFCLLLPTDTYTEICVFANVSITTLASWRPYYYKHDKETKDERTSLSPEAVTVEFYTYGTALSILSFLGQFITVSTTQTESTQRGAADQALFSLNNVSDGKAHGYCTLPLLIL